MFNLSGLRYEKQANLHIEAGFFESLAYGLLLLQRVSTKKGGNMKKLGMILVVLLSLLGIDSQAGDKTKKELRKQERAAKKLEKERLLMENLDSIRSSVQSKAFVLQADMLRGRYGTVNVLDANNFIKINGDQVVIQTANPHRIGFNGLGGITINGQIIQYDIFEDNNAVRINMQVSTVELGHITLSMTLGATGNAWAHLRGNFGLQVSFNGQFAALDNLRQFEGMRLF